MPLASRVASFTPLPGRHTGAFAKRAVALAIGCLSITSAPAIDFQFIYGDAEGTGFLDPVLGAQRQQRLADAAAVWGRLIMSSHGGETVVVQASFADYAPGSTILASASPNFFYSGFASRGPKFGDTNYPKALADHLNGGDLSTRHDITMKVNRATDFYYGSATPGPTQFDFISVAAHEIGHGLGFTSSFRQSGHYGVYGDGTYVEPFMLPEMLPKPYDRFLTLGAGGPGLLGLSSDAREAAMTGGNVFWSGANAIVGNGGNPVALAAPAMWNAGSSIGHLNDPATLMSASIGPGQVERTPSAVERGMLRDMGWTVSVSPSELAWTGAASNRIGQAANWASGIAPLPGDSLIFGAAAGSGTALDFGVTLYTLGRIIFTPDAPAYALNFASGTDTTFTGEGLVNRSSQAPALVLATGSVMAFENAAGAANASFRLAGGETTLVSNPPLDFYFARTAGAQVAFRDDASAANASFHVGGGAGNGGIKAQVIYSGSTNAADAVIFNEAGRAGPGILFEGRPTTQFGFGGETRFEDSANAGRARITNQGITTFTSQGTGGYTTFAGRSNAGNAVIENLGGEGFAVGGVTEFVDDASAGQATFTNRSGRAKGAGRTSFFGRSTADRATFTNTAGAGFGSGSDPGWLVFREFSNAGSATIVNQLGGRTEFFDDTDAGRATIRLAPLGASGGSLVFHQRATAGNANIIASARDPGANSSHVVIELTDQSSAGSATFRAEAGAAPFQLNFRGQSGAGSASFQDGADGQNRIEFYQSSSAGTATLRVAANGIIGLYDNASAAAATINTAGWLIASGNATLGSANITIAGNDATSNRIETLKVDQRASVADATIVLLGGSAPAARGAEMIIRNSGRAVDDRVGTATIAAFAGLNGGQGGSVALEVNLNAPGLRLITDGNGRFRMVPLFQSGNAGVLQVGSIEGSGRFEIDGGLGVEFTTGYLGTSTAVSGTIAGNFKQLSKVGNGTLSLDGMNTYTALTSVDGGALAVNGSIATDVVVNAGASLMGTGSVGGKVTVNAGGTLAPGLSPGTLLVGSLDLLEGSVLEMELGPDLRDLLVVAGDAFITGTLELELLGGYLPRSGDIVALFEVGGMQQGSFSKVLFPDLAPGFQYQFTMQEKTFAMVALNNALPVPEPGSGWLFVCGILTIGCWRLKAPCAKGRERSND
jgi:autotransporter-associated beta strand protein